MPAVITLRQRQLTHSVESALAALRRSLQLPGPSGLTPLATTS